jgi:hypothetical protein
MGMLVFLALLPLMTSSYEHLPFACYHQKLLLGLQLGTPG